MCEGKGGVPTWPTISLPVIRRAEFARDNLRKERVHHKKKTMFIERPLRKVISSLTMRAGLHREG